MANNQGKKFMRWDRNSEDGRTLERMFRNNEIDPSAQPSSILHALGWNGRYSANAFRSAFHRMRRRFEESRTVTPKSTATVAVGKRGLFDDEDSLSSDDEDDEDEIVGTAAEKKAPAPLLKKVKTGTPDRRITRSTAVAMKRAAVAFSSSTPKTIVRKGSAYDCDGLGDILSTPMEGTTENGTPFNSPPLYWQWCFEDKEARGHIAVNICLPSGLCSDCNLNGEVVPTVSPDGTSLLVRFVWPEFFTDMDCIKRGIMQRDPMAPETMLSLIMGGKKELKELRKGLRRSVHQPICCSTLIPLKHEVETTIKKFIPIHARGSLGMCVLIILKLRETEIVELERKEYDFRYIDTTRKEGNLKDDNNYW